jgi:hypothetical protein
MKTKKKATRATKLATVFLRRVNARGSLTLTFSLVARWLSV